MNKNLIFKSKNDNMYFYNSRLGMMFNIESEAEIPGVLKMYDKFVQDTKLKSDYTASDAYDHLYKKAKGFNCVILEVTDACNLRCKYCVYSDNYPTTRSHGDKLMSFEVAKSAVDDYMENFKKVRRFDESAIPAVVFYGGEPLLNLDLIEKVVEYINEKYSEYGVSFGITTNATLLNDRAIKILCENKFNIMISLDGDKENNDRNRVFKNKKGTYDIIINNYKKLKNLYPDVKIDVSACFDYATDLELMSDTFREHDLDIGNIAQIFSESTSYYDLFTKEDKMNFLKKYAVMKKRILSALREGKDKNDLDPVDKYFYQLYDTFSANTMMGGRKVSCIPGEKIFVSIDGDYYTCEKVDKLFKIGDVRSGLDLDRVALLVRSFNETRNKKCNGCEIEYDCDICFLNCHSADEITFPAKTCSVNKSAFKNTLIDLVNVWEEHPDVLDESFSSYYKCCLK